MREARRAIACAALAAVLTAAIAWPVIAEPGARIFGREIAGRHHDPFTVMALWMSGGQGAAYWQPLTDVAGIILVHLFGTVAGFNIAVLATFPLTAVSTFLLARYAGLGAIGAAFAALAFAFAPFRIAHAAYHPHIVQTQWLPLFLLALLACVDRPSLARAAALSAATLAVALSDFYGGVIALVIAAVTGPAYWISTSPRPRAATSLLVPAVAIASMAAPIAFAMHGTNAPPHLAGDAIRYAARPWAWLVPAVDHQILGEAAGRLWRFVNAGPALLEQQISPGLGATAFAVVAVASRDRRWIWIAAALGWAWLCTLAPAGWLGPLRPASVIVAWLPAFRAPARFGVMIALAVALLGGAGLSRLAERRGMLGRIALACFAALFILDLAPWRARSRDVLPTAAHRWVVNQPSARALDCAAPSAEDAALAWLAPAISPRAGAIADCRDPGLAERLAAGGYTHLIVRTTEPLEIAARAMRDPGLRLDRNVPGARLFTLTPAAPLVATGDMRGFHQREYDGRSHWRWMAARGWWHVTNRAATAVRASLVIDWAAFAGPREIAVSLDGHHALAIVVPVDGAAATLGPFTLEPGEHRLEFRSANGATVAGHDPRALSIRVNQWHWKVEPS